MIMRAVLALALVWLFVPHGPSLGWLDGEGAYESMFKRLHEMRIEIRKANQLAPEFVMTN